MNVNLTPVANLKMYDIDALWLKKMSCDKFIIKKLPICKDLSKWDGSLKWLKYTMPFIFCWWTGPKFIKLVRTQTFLLSRNRLPVELLLVFFGLSGALLTLCLVKEFAYHFEIGSCWITGMCDKRCTMLGDMKLVLFYWKILNCNNCHIVLY